MQSFQIATARSCSVDLSRRCYKNNEYDSLLYDKPLSLKMNVKIDHGKIKQNKL